MVRCREMEEEEEEDDDDEYAKLFRGMNPPRVVIDNDSCDNATVIRVDRIQKHGILLEAVQVLVDLNLIITKAYISSDGNWFMDVFNVTDQDGSKLQNREIIDHIQRCLESEDCHMPPAMGRSGGSAPSEDESTTSIELTGTDRPGLLFEVVNMSASALKDLNISQSTDLEKGKDNSVKSCISRPVLNGNKCVSKEENAPPACPDAVTNGNEASIVDVEYIDSENLVDLPDIDATLSTVAKRLDSKDWVMTCEALNNVRQLAKYHKERLQELLEPLVPLFVKSVKNPRSAVCKTALMTCADIFKAYGDLMVESIDPLLMQLFLKASQDKRFVCEAAEAALISMTSWISPLLLLPRMQPYLKNRNPRIRAKVSVCFSKSVPRLDMEGMKEYGMDKLIQIAATQLSDQLPESREAARNLALELQVFYEKYQASTSGENDDTISSSSDAESWEGFCQSKLSALSAQAILRVTSTPKESVTVGVASAAEETVAVDC